MFNGVNLKRAIVVVFSTAMCTNTGIAYAFDICKNLFGKTNQPGWRGDNRGRGNYYGDPRTNLGYGYRGRPYGYGWSGYGYDSLPSPAYRYPAREYGAPQPRTDALQAQIYRLQEQIRNLERALTQESARTQSISTDPGTS
jgi:hypothetical protein